MKRHTFTNDERKRGGVVTSSMEYDEPRPCPICGRTFKKHKAYAGHLGLHGFAKRFCDGDMDRARLKFALTGAAASDPAPWNGAFAEGHQVLAQIKRDSYRGEELSKIDKEGAWDEYQEP